MTEQEMKTEEKSEKCGTGGKPSPFCRADCKLCKSEHMEYVHSLMNSKTYKEIQTILLDEKGFDISPSSISRHFSNFKKYRQGLVEIEIGKQVEQEVSVLATHQRQAAFLADAIFEQIKTHLQAGTLQLSVSDWERAVKIYHSILKGTDDKGLDDLVGVFQNAASKHGFSLSQGVLFKS